MGFFDRFSAKKSEPSVTPVSSSDQTVQNAAPVGAVSVKSHLGDWFIDYASNGFGSWDLFLSGYGSAPPAIAGN